MTTTTVLDIPHRDPSYPAPIARHQTFPSLDDAIAFAERNEARLFYIRDGVWAFENYGKRSPEQIIE